MYEAKTLLTRSGVPPGRVSNCQYLWIGRISGRGFDGVLIFISFDERAVHERGAGLDEGDEAGVS
jgi:hypothetical protein